MTQLPPLATGSYRDFRPEMGVPVATSVGKPRKPMPGMETVNELAPYGVFNIKPPLPEPEFRAKYLARCAEKQPIIEAKLIEIGERHPGETLVLLCWCQIESETAFCHRREAADFLIETYGIDVPELCIVGGHVHSDTLGL